MGEGWGGGTLTSRLLLTLQAEFPIGIASKGAVTAALMFIQVSIKCGQSATESPAYFLNVYYCDSDAVNLGLTDFCLRLSFKPHLRYRQSVSTVKRRTLTHS